MFIITNLNWFPPQNKEMFSSLHHKPHELLTQYLLYLIRLTIQAMRMALSLKLLTCLMPILTLTELIDPSIITFSFSLRLTTKGVNTNSLLLLEYNLLIMPPRSLEAYFTSTSGLLCLSTTCDSKFSRQRAAVSEARTALR